VKRAGSTISAVAQTMHSVKSPKHFRPQRNVPMLILRYSPASPYARKIRIAADILGLADRIEIAGVDLADPADSIRVQNPLGKIPALVLEDGSSLYDSRVIAEYLDHLAGGEKLFPADPARRFAALRLQALGDGICDAAVLLRSPCCNRARSTVR
jgi:glutathione S-transferase